MCDMCDSTSRKITISFPGRDRRNNFVMKDGRETRWIQHGQIWLLYYQIHWSCGEDHRVEEQSTLARFLYAVPARKNWFGRAVDFAFVFERCTVSPAGNINFHPGYSTPEFHTSSPPLKMPVFVCHLSDEARALLYTHQELHSLAEIIGRFLENNAVR